MERFKQKVKDSFSLASTSYDQVAHVQKRAAQQLVNALTTQLPDFRPQNILDLGTGTGNLLQYLVQSYPSSRYTLNDLSASMLNIALPKLDKVLNKSIVIGDLETLNFAPHDLCISNFALQWCTNLYQTLNKHYNNSKVFAFTTLLQGTFAALEQVFLTREIPYFENLAYPAEADLHFFLSSLKTKKYVYFSRVFEVKFANIKEFLKYVKALGANITKFQPNLAQLKQVLFERAVFTTQYHVFFAILVKE